MKSDYQLYYNLATLYGKFSETSKGVNKMAKKATKKSDINNDIPITPKVDDDGYTSIMTDDIAAFWPNKTTEIGGELIGTFLKEIMREVRGKNTRTFIILETEGEVNIGVSGYQIEKAFDAAKVMPGASVKFIFKGKKDLANNQTLKMFDVRVK